MARPRDEEGVDETDFVCVEALAALEGPLIAFSLPNVKALAYELPNFNALFQPPPVPLVPDQYEGFELRYKRFTFRPAEFKIEGIILALLILYLTIYYFGKRLNTSRSYAWIKAHSAFYATQFSNPFNSGEVLADGPADLVAYSTGRRGVYSLHTTFALLPRHDIFSLLYIFVRGIVQIEWTPRDEIRLDFTIRHDDGSRPGFVWAVVNKDELNTLRTDRFDLGMFTKISDAIPLHVTLQGMTETTDIHHVLLKSGAAPTLLETLKNVETLKYFRSLIITDQPIQRPDTWELKEPVPSLLTRPRHLILTLSLPPTVNASSTLPIVKAAFEIVDVLAFINGSNLSSNHPARLATLQPETIKKLRTTRKDWDERLEKERTAEKVAEEEAAKAVAKKRAEDERIAKLPAAEQQKILEKERKRAMRKAQIRGAKK